MALWCCPGDVDQSWTVDGDNIITFVDMWVVSR